MFKTMVPAASFLVLCASCQDLSDACAQTPEQSCSFPKPAPAASYTEFPRLTYLQADDEGVKLDLYVPRHPADPPLVIQLHGGGWAGGSGAQPIMVYNARVLAGQGFAVASLDYRLVKGGRNLFPASLQDVRCAVKWLKSKSVTYGYDGQSIAALGFSAGANLAALLGTAASMKADFDSPSCSVKGQTPAVNSVAAFYAPTNFTDMTNVGPKSRDIYADYLGADPSADLPLAKRASPITYVSRKSPPFFIVHGRRDNLVPVEQQTEFVTALRAAGVQVDYIELPGLGHAFDPFDTHVKDQVQSTTCGLLAFLHATLRK